METKQQFFSYLTSWSFLRFVPESLKTTQTKLRVAVASTLLLLIVTIICVAVMSRKNKSKEEYILLENNAAG